MATDERRPRLSAVGTRLSEPRTARRTAVPFRPIVSHAHLAPGTHSHTPEVGDSVETDGHTFRVDGVDGVDGGVSSVVVRDAAESEARDGSENGSVDER